MKAKTLTACLLLALSFALAACGGEPPSPVPSQEAELPYTPEEKPNLVTLDTLAYITVVFDTPEYEMPTSWQNEGWTYKETPLQHNELVTVCELHPLFGTATNVAAILDPEKCKPLPFVDVKSLLVWTEEDGEREVIYFR